MVDLLLKKYGWICEWEDELAKDTPEFIECVKVHAAEDPATEPGALAKLAGDKSSWVRYKVAENPNCPVQVLYTLKDDTEVARGLASNPNLPQKIFYHLLEKGKDDIKNIIKEEIVKNPNCPVDILDNLASSNEAGIRSRVAGNPHSSPEILEKVFQHTKRGGDLEFLVFEALAFNHHTPPQILEKIAEYRGEYEGVITRLVTNPSTPPQTLRKLGIKC